jgi:hypothetical protein
MAAIMGLLHPFVNRAADENTLPPSYLSGLSTAGSAGRQGRRAKDKGCVAVGERPSRLPVPRSLIEARRSYRSARRQELAVCVQALLEYAHGLQLHTYPIADVGDADRALLGECVRLLEAALLVGASTSMIQEHVAALDEQSLYVEVCLEMAGAGSLARRARLTDAPSQIEGLRVR